MADFVLFLLMFFMLLAIPIMLFGFIFSVLNGAVTLILGEETAEALLFITLPISAVPVLILVYIKWPF